MLLFDEPLSNLDARLRREMREEIRALQQRLKLTVAYVTHDQSEALAVSDQIIVMDHGVHRAARHARRSCTSGRPASSSPASWARRCCSTARRDPMARWRWAPSRSRRASRCSPARCGWRCGPRPGACRCTRPALEAVVQKRAYLGSVQELTLQLPLGSIFVVSEAEPLLEPGQRIWLNLSGHGVSVVPR